MTVIPLQLHVLSLPLLFSSSSTKYCAINTAKYGSAQETPVKFQSTKYMNYSYLEDVWKKKKKGSCWYSSLDTYFFKCQCSIIA